MTDRTKSSIHYMVAGLGAISLFLAGLLWNSNYDYVTKVDAKCVSLQEDKVDKVDFNLSMARIESYMKELRDNDSAIINKIELIERKVPREYIQDSKKEKYNPDSNLLNKER